MKLEDIKGNPCLILCDRSQRKKVESVLRKYGLKSFGIDWRNEPKSAISIWWEQMKYTDVIDHNNPKGNYSKFIIITASQFLNDNK